MIAISEINDIQRLNRFRLLWKDLYEKTPHASFFQSLDWLESYWNHYGRGKKLRTLIVSVAGKPIGIVPLIVKPIQTSLGRLRVLTYPLDDWGMFYGPLGPYPAATLAGAMRYLQESPRDWDTIDLQFIDQEGVDRGRTQNAMRGRGFQSYKQLFRSTGIVEMHSDWIDYWIDRPDKLRRRYQSAEESLAESGTLRLVRYRPEGVACDDSDPCWELYSGFEEMLRHSGSKQLKRSELNFYREVYVKAVWAGAADINLLYAGDQPVAAALNLHRNGLVENIGLVCAPNVPKHTITALMGRMLQDSFERGDTSFQFNPRDSGSLADWKTSTVRSYRYTHFARIVPKAQMLRFKHCVGSWLNEYSQSERVAGPSQQHAHLAGLQSRG